MSRNKQRAKVPSERKATVWRRDGYRCRYCRTAVTNPSPDIPQALWATVDHVRPRALGGKNTLGNLVTACAACNGKKGMLPVASFIKEGGIGVRMKAGAALKFGYRPSRDSDTRRMAETGTGSERSSGSAGLQASPTQSGQE